MRPAARCRMLGVVLSGVGLSGAGDRAMTSGGVMRRHRLLLAFTTAVLTVTAAVALVAVRPGATSVAAGGPATGFDTTAVSALLHAHAAALRDRDRTAFAAVLDDSDAATTFRATQLAAFDHTDGVPFASFDWALDRPVLDAPPLAAARARLGPSAAIVRVDLTYAYAGVDALPATHPQWFTVVHRADGWKLASDTDLVDTGGTSWRGPWDFGPLTVLRGRTCLVLGHPASDATTDVAASQQQLQTYAADVDAAVPAVTAVWGTQWPQRVAVEVAATQPELDSLTGVDYPLASVAALAVAEPVQSATPGPDTAAGQRIVVSGSAAPTLTAAGRQVLLRHELTHVATRGVTVEGMPTWVVEGFADWIGNLAGGQPVRTVAAELVTGIAARGVPVGLPADDAFVPDGGTAGGDAGAAGTGTGTGTDPAASTPAQAYEQAWLAFVTVVQLAGPNAPAALYRAVATDVTAGSTTPVDTALQQVVGLDTAAFTARWQDLLRTELT